MTLQVFHDIKEENRKRHEHSKPDLSLIRPVIFWDTNINTIEWRANKRAIIERVLERANEQEKEEIKKFYGEATFNAVASELKMLHGR